MVCQMRVMAAEPKFTYTTVRVVHGVHGHTTSLGPRVALDSELVLGTRSLCSSSQHPVILPSQLVTCGNQ
jgi:hypothetical protein